MNRYKTFAVFLGLSLAAVSGQTAEPTIKYEVNGTNLILTYSGTLLQSTDAVNWTEVKSASSPYKVSLNDKQLFFCSQGGGEVQPIVPGENFSTLLPGGVSLDMNWIKPGTFFMGSPTDELGRFDSEFLHVVRLTQGYWMGKFEVTQAQYEAVMGTNPSKWKGADLPVEMVSWDDAMVFCAKLTTSEKAAGRLPEGYEYTLPTEAQWEYACRGGTATALNNGKNLSDKYECPEMDEVGWYDGNAAYKTHPVGQKKPNARGLYDMHGNVNEWCSDWYKEDYYSISPETDPTGPGTGNYRVNRGGSWYTYATSCRSANRSNGSSTDTYNFTGFRVVLAPTKNITIPLSEDVDLDMIWIEPGTFIMGSPEDESCRGDDETQHSVKLSQGFWLGKYEITQSQYEAVMGMNPSEFQGSNLPVENVSWYDTTNFCAKLTEQMKAAGRLPAGYEFSLPTEAQWEYACRAGTTTSLNSGKNLSDDEECPEMDEVAWYSYNSNETTHPVGQKLPNAWGLYDMHGNVIEWCSDWYGDYPVSEANSIVDPIGPEAGSYRVNRGGYWDERAGEGRSACRYANSPDLRSSYRGFRVALVKKVLPLTITINDTKTYDGTPLVSSYTGVAVSGLMPGDSLTAGAATTAGSDIGTYLYPVRSKITTPFDTAKGIENYTVTYVITQKIISAPLTITINDTKTYDGTPLVSSYIVATATGLKQGDKLAAGAATTAGSDIGTYLYPVSSKITTPFDTAKGIKNYMVTYVITQKITSASESKDMTIPLSDTVNLDMIWIEPGTFTMGSPSDELGRDEDEIQHEVTLTKGYWLGKYEVTQAQYEAVMGKNPSCYKGADLPVEQVSWNDAVKFCEWLTAQERAAGRLPEGYEYTLPTEAQWEYACRAGTTTAFNNGTNIPTMLQRTDRPCPNLDPLAWYGYNSGEYNSAGNYTGNGKTFPVGQKQPNAWGLYDMHGNVWEWCLDWYGSYPSSAVTDPKGPATGSDRVLRGGSWDYGANGCRSANRGYHDPGYASYYNGFRVALAPVQ